LKLLGDELPREVEAPAVALGFIRACRCFLTTYFRTNAAARWSKLDFLGTVSGDRFKAFGGGSRLFEKGVQRQKN
jgi:hypothetical protein